MANLILVLVLCGFIIGFANYLKSKNLTRAIISGLLGFFLTHCFLSFAYCHMDGHLNYCYLNRFINFNEPLHRILTEYGNIFFIPVLIANYLFYRKK